MAAEGPKWAMRLSEHPSLDSMNTPSRQSYLPHPVRCQPSLGPLCSATRLGKKLCTPFLQSYLRLSSIEAYKPK